MVRGIEFRLMSDPLPDEKINQPADNPTTGTNPTAMFTPPPVKEGGMPLSAWVAAGGVVLAILVGLLLVGKKKGPIITGIQPPAAYAINLPLTGLAMSESTSLSGGKSTFIDGHIRNAGPATVTGITVQVLFRNEEQMPPQVETLPLALVRTREPYVDTQPVSAAPLAPGEDREFRLIFESIPANWNMQMPDIHVVRVDLK